MELYEKADNVCRILCYCVIAAIEYSQLSPKGHNWAVQEQWWCAALGIQNVCESSSFYLLRYLHRFLNQKDKRIQFLLQKSLTFRNFVKSKILYIFRDKMSVKTKNMQYMPKASDIVGEWLWRRMIVELRKKKAVIAKFPWRIS